MAVTRDDRRTVTQLLQEAERAISLALTDPAGQNMAVQERARINIVARTKAGRDIRDQIFTEYAERTKKYKRKKGQRIRPPTMTDSGDMLADVEGKPINRTTVTTEGRLTRNQFQIAALGFRTRESERKEEWHRNGTIHMPERNWFGMTEPDAGELAESYETGLRHEAHRDRRRRRRIILFKV